MERVLLLTLIGQDSCESERELAELEGLVRSAGGQPCRCDEPKKRQHESPNPLGERETPRGRPRGPAKRCFAGDHRS
jgi:hypothetical protein